MFRSSFGPCGLAALVFPRTQRLIARLERSLWERERVFNRDTGLTAGAHRRLHGAYAARKIQAERAGTEERLVCAIIAVMQSRRALARASSACKRFKQAYSDALFEVLHKNRGASSATAFTRRRAPPTTDVIAEFVSMRMRFCYSKHDAKIARRLRETERERGASVWWGVQ